MKSIQHHLLSLTLGVVLALSPSFSIAGSFTVTGHMQFARRRHTATRLSSGKVLVAGGANSTGTLATAEVFTPASGTFARTGNMKIARNGHTATLLANGKVLIAGGTNATGTLASAELFNPATGTFNEAANMNTARIGHTATLLGNGKVLVAGGGTAKAELYDPSTGLFTPTKNMRAPRMGHTATLLKNGKVLLSGGTDTGTALGDLFDPTTSTFSGTATGGRTELWQAATLLQDGRAFLAGGEVTTLISGGSTRCCIFGPVSSALAIGFTTTNNSFFVFGHMSSSRAFPSATRLANGQVLIAGGATVGSYPTKVTLLATAELFNPSTLSFTNTGNMTTSRAWHTATILGDGSVLVVGGINVNGSVLSSAEQYH
jgi:hypothetical protein